MRNHLALSLVAALAMAACGTGSGGAGDDYVGAIPEASELAVEVGEDGSTTSALESEESAVVGDPAKFQAVARKIAKGLNKLVADTHGGMKWVIENSDPIDFKWLGFSCKLFEADGEKVHWQLVTCLKDKKAKTLLFVLRGKPLNSAGDYMAVIAGEGKALPHYQGKWRGFGWVGYDFDHLAALRGDKVGGKVGIGYRVAGKARQLTIGLKGFIGPDATEPESGIYRNTRVIGIGGRFSFVTRGDFVAKDPSGKPIPGQDNVNELLLGRMGWRVDGKARTVVAVCDGTLGSPKACLVFVQCWDANEKLTFDKLLSKDEKIAWSEKECPGLPDAVAFDDAPGDEDLNAPAGTDPEVDAPATPIPSAIPEENG